MISNIALKKLQLSEDPIIDVFIPSEFQNGYYFLSNITNENQNIKNKLPIIISLLREIRTSCKNINLRFEHNDDNYFYEYPDIERLLHENRNIKTTENIFSQLDYFFEEYPFRKDIDETQLINEYTLGNEKYYYLTLDIDTCIKILKVYDKSDANIHFSMYVKFFNIRDNVISNSIRIPYDYWDENFLTYIYSNRLTPLKNLLINNKLEEFKDISFLKRTELGKKILKKWKKWHNSPETELSKNEIYREIKKFLRIVVSFNGCENKYDDFKKQMFDSLNNL